MIGRILQPLPMPSRSVNRRSGRLLPRQSWPLLCFLILLSLAACTDATQRWREKADDAYATGDYPVAAEAYAKVLVLDETQTEARFFLAVCQQLSGDYAPAIAGFSRVLEEVPDGYKALLNRGHCHYATADFAAARDDYASVLELEPGYGLALNPLAHMHFYLGDTALACRTLKEAAASMAAREVDPALREACSDY